jgi:hypothetical protein
MLVFKPFVDFTIKVIGRVDARDDDASDGTICRSLRAFDVLD